MKDMPVEEILKIVDAWKFYRNNGQVVVESDEVQLLEMLAGYYRDLGAEKGMISAFKHDNQAPIRLVMYCPAGHQHVDDEAWAEKVHRTHQCQQVLGTVNGPRKCGLEWRPSSMATVGVKEIL